MKTTLTSLVVLVACAALPAVAQPITFPRTEVTAACDIDFADIGLIGEGIPARLRVFDGPDESCEIALVGNRPEETIQLVARGVLDDYVGPPLAARRFDCRIWTGRRDGVSQFQIVTDSQIEIGSDGSVLMRCTRR